MAETIATYLDRWLAKAASGGLRNPLMRMPIKRFRLLTSEELAAIETGKVWRVGTLADPITRNLWKNFEEKIRERGEHTAFVTFGSIEITLAGSSMSGGKRTALMPVWLKRVQLNKREDNITAQLQEDPAWDLNPELEAVLRDLAIDVKTGPKGDPVRLVKWLSSQAGNRAIVNVQGSYLGCFSSQHLIIRERIKDGRWRRSVAQNDAVRCRIAGQPMWAPIDFDVPVTDTSIEDLGVVVPVDDSQLRVIQMARDGRSLIVQGPPGTGKSQTITNLIANAWWHGKRVLLICDKRTAIRQVEERLQKCGLGAALLNLHDEGLDKHDFLKRAVSRFGRQTNAASKYPFLELAKLRDLLNLRVKAGEEAAHGSIGIKRREALCGMIRLREMLPTIPKLEISNWQSLSRQRLNRIFGGFSEWESLSAVIADNHHTWNAVVLERFRGDANARQEVSTLLAQVAAEHNAIDTLRDDAACLGFVGMFSGRRELEDFIALAALVAVRPEFHALIIDRSDLTTAHIGESERASERRRTLIADHYPIDLERQRSEEEISEAIELLRREKAETWTDLAVAAECHDKRLRALDAVNEKYLRMSTDAGMRPLDHLAACRSQMTIACELLALGVAIPDGWWDQTSSSPAAVLLRWEKELQSLGAHAKAGPFPIDLAAVARLDATQWKHIEAKSENGFNAVSYCFRYVNDRRVKAALGQMYPALPKKGKRPWADLVLHAIKARDIIRQVAATAEIHPDLRELTAAYLAGSLASPATAKLVGSSKFSALREASRRVELTRQRTDFFILDGPIWRTWWAIPGSRKLQQIKDCCDLLAGLELPCPLEDSISHNQRWLQERHDSIRHFIDAQTKEVGDMTHGVLNTFQAQNEYVAAGRKLAELSRYSVIPGASCPATDWVAMRKVIEWRDGFVRARGQQKLNIDNLAWPRTEALARTMLARIRSALSSLSEYFKGAEGWDESFATLVNRVAEVGAGMSAADSWLLKAEWAAKMSAWPEMASVWDRLVGGQTPAGEAKPLFCYNLLRLAAPPVEPNGHEFASHLKLFGKQDEQLETWSVEALCDKIRARQTEASSRYPLDHAKLQHLSGLQRIRGKVREICNEHLDLLLETKPGWLMSPISLANLIDLDALQRDKPLFDLVVFDEASQVQVLEGLLAMGFARQTIIVGDDKQLPPTNFFASAAIEEEDPVDLGDSESLIEEFQGALTSAMLMAHYRSETPDLISFSNRKFYEGKLEMYPPAKVAGIGRRRHYVAGGVFDSGKSRTNVAEAKAVAKLVNEHVDQSPTRSLGVVTMNAEQMDLIETLLLEAPAAVRRFCGDDERFFIRNLETVQGDEMDRIIVSLTYGKNPEGKFHASFLGPLTRKGGHRRLNVALSRSKSGMTIVTSMAAVDLAQTSAQSHGFNCLKELLEELETGDGDSSFGITNSRFAKRCDGVSDVIYCESGFEEQVVEFLENLGCDVRCQVGAGETSKFRIDIVVVENGIPMLAVECDGAAYHSSMAARTRDRSRQRQLEKLGWRFHRVWSTNWWLYPDAEQEALKQAIALARRAFLPSRNAPAMGAAVSVAGSISTNGASN